MTPDSPTRLGPTLVAVALASVLLPFAVTAPAVALPAIAADLGASPTAAQWLINGYAIAFATTVLAAGSVADRVGCVRVLRAGTALLGVASLFVAAAPSILVADVIRVVQAIGAAGVLASGAAVVAHAAPADQRARAFGVLGASFGAGLALGPLAGGLLTPLGWRVQFVVAAAVAIVALALTRFAPESRDPQARPLDLPGMALFGVALLALSSAFVVAPEAGWTGAATLGLAVLAVAAAAAFVAVELRRAHPMFDVRLFRRPAFVAVVCQPFTITLGFVILLVFLPPFIQGAGGHGVVAAGTLLLPLTAPVLALPLAAGPIVGRLGIRGTLVSASLLIGAGALLLLLLRGDAAFWSLAPGLAVFGVGVGLAFSVMDNAAITAVPVDRAGAASGMFNTMRLTGESLAIAAAGAVLTSLTAARLTSGSAADVVGGRVGGPDAAAAFAGALHVTVVGLAVISVAGAVGTWLALAPDQRSRRRNATTPTATATTR